MGRSLAFMAVTGACGVWLVSAAQAAPPAPRAEETQAARSGLVRQAQIFPRRYYRKYGPYAVPPVAPVVPPVPPVVVEEPAIVVPMRPASCGEYRYWNGQACVDARYNTPYLGPKP